MKQAQLIVGPTVAVHNAFGVDITCVIIEE